MRLTKVMRIIKNVGAHVTANDSGNWFSSFTIDKGEK